MDCCRMYGYSTHTTLQVEPIYKIATKNGGIKEKRSAMKLAFKSQNLAEFGYGACRVRERRVSVSAMM